jgi:hypothetical protein
MIPSILFFALCVILGYTSGQIWDLSRFSYWSRVDAAVVLLGFGAVVIAAGEASRLIPRNTLGYKRARALSRLASLRDSVAGWRAQMSIVFQRSEYSPPAETVAKDQQEFNAARDWIGSIAKKLAPPPALKPEEVAGRTQEQQDIDDFPELDPDALLANFPASADDPVLTAGRDEVVEWIRTYKQLLQEYKDAKTKLEPTSVEQFLVLIGPYLASLATGLGVASALYQP